MTTFTEVPVEKRYVAVRLTSGLTLSGGSDGNHYVVNWWQNDKNGQLFQASHSQCKTRADAIVYAKNIAKELTKKYGVNYYVKKYAPTNSIK